MARLISALAQNDLPDLRKFLTMGFSTPTDADFAAPDVLRWKYLDPIEQQRCGEHRTGCGPEFDAGAPCSLIARNDLGHIIGHLGICRTAFVGHALAARDGCVSTMHIIDWVGSPEHRAVGISLMRRAHEGTVTQFGLGVSQAAL